MTAPTRITRSRAKGWRKPEGAVIVSRGTIWGNPFTVSDAITIAQVKPERAQKFVTDCFRYWLNGDRQHWMGNESDAAAALILRRLPELRGRDLVCWCEQGCACHADVLMEMANK